MKKILIAILVVTTLAFAITGCDIINGIINPAKSYTVTFDTDGGSAVENQTVAENEAATKPADPTKDGYTFAGWYVGENEYDFATPVTADVTVTAKWNAVVTPDPDPTPDPEPTPDPTPVNHTVAFTTGGGNAVAPQTVTEGATATKPADPTKYGYTFAGWYIGETEYDFATPVTADITIAAKWTVNVYTVTFDTVGGTAVDSVTAEHGSTVVAPAANPTKTGYTFTGWDYDFTKPIKADTTITAKWTPNGYEVVFNTDGGSAIAPIVVNYGSPVVNPGNPTKTGYTFAGWYVGETEYDFATPVTDHITVTAKWNAIPYTVTFNSNGGSDVAPATVPYGTAAEKPADPTKIAHKFLGWFIGDTEYDFATLITGNVELTAKWEVIVPDFPADMAGKYTGTETDGLYVNNAYTVVIDAENDTIAITFENSYNTIDVPVNYMIWENNVLTVNYTVGGNPADISFTYADGKFTTDTAVAGYALTLARTYTVTLDSNGANKDKEYTVAHGDTLDEYKPSRTGYNLVGWYDESGNKFDFATPITSDMTLIAEWEIKTFTLTFVGQDGETVVSTITVDYNTVIGTVALPTSIPTTDGYKFNGNWYTSLTGTSPITPKTTTKITSDKTYYPGLIAPMTDIAGTWTGTDSKGNTYTMLVDADTQTVAITTVNGDTTTEYSIASIYYKEFVGLSSTAVKLVVRYTTAASSSESTLTLTYAADGTFTGSNSLTLVKEGATTYTVTFDTDGGSTIDPQTVAKDATAEKPADPTKDGFTFAGWYIGENEYDFATPVTTDITITAKWIDNSTIVEYTVTFDLNGGKLTGAVLTQTVTDGTTATDIGTPTRSNYTFLGWYLGENEYDFTAAVTGDITLVAKWKGVNKTIKIYDQAGSVKYEIQGEYGKTIAQILSKELTGTESDTLSEETLKSLADDLMTIEHSYFTGDWYTSVTGTTVVNFADTLTGNKNIYAIFVAPVVKELEGTWSCVYNDKTYTFTINTVENDNGDITGVTAAATIDGEACDVEWIRTNTKTGSAPNIIIRYTINGSSGKSFTIKQVELTDDAGNGTGVYVWQYSSQTLTKV